MAERFFYAKPVAAIQDSINYYYRILNNPQKNEEHKTLNKKEMLNWISEQTDNKVKFSNAFYF